MYHGAPPALYSQVAITGISTPTPLNTAPLIDPYAGPDGVRAYFNERGIILNAAQPPALSPEDLRATQSHLNSKQVELLSMADIQPKDAARILSRFAEQFKSSFLASNDQSLTSGLIHKVEQEAGTSYGYHVTNGFSFALMQASWMLNPPQLQNFHGHFYLSLDLADCENYFFNGSPLLKQFEEAGLLVSDSMRALAKKDVLLRVDLRGFPMLEELARDAERKAGRAVYYDSRSICAACPPPARFVELVGRFA